MKVDEIYFSFMSLFSILALVGVHIYIKNKLGARHDNGLLFAAGAMFAWLIMALWEGYGKVKFSEAEYLGIRKLISIFNTGLFLSSLIYFKDSWYKVNKKLENIKYHIIAIITTLLLLIAYVIIPDKEDWSYFEGWISILVATLLSSSMAVTLYFREEESQNKKINLLFFVPIIAGLLLIVVQVFDKDFREHSMLDPIDENFYLAFRMLSRPMLVISYLLVAMTWLQKKQDEINFFKSIQNQIGKIEDVTPKVEPRGESSTHNAHQGESSAIISIEEVPQQDEPKQEASHSPSIKNQALVNQIAFSDDDMKIGVTLQTGDDINFNEAEVFFGRSREVYKLLRNCAAKVKEKGFFDINKDLKGSSNHSKDLSDIVKLLNEGKQVKGHGRNSLPDAPIIYQRFFITGENKGEYKLPFLPENIIFLPKIK
jgi:hypothetical protein